MLWNGLDGIGGFLRTLARDLHAGGGFTAEACPESRHAGIERDAEHTEEELGERQTLDCLRVPRWTSLEIRILSPENPENRPRKTEVLKLTCTLSAGAVPY